MPGGELIVSARYFVAARKYKQALTILCISYPREPQERFLFGEVTLSLLNAIAQIKIGDIDGAMADFEKAYDLSLSGEFEMFFIEFGRDLLPRNQYLSSWTRTTMWTPSGSLSKKS